MPPRFIGAALLIPSVRTAELQNNSALLRPFGKSTLQNRGLRQPGGSKQVIGLRSRGLAPSWVCRQLSPPRGTSTKRNHFGLNLEPYAFRELVSICSRIFNILLVLRMKITGKYIASAAMKTKQPITPIVNCGILFFEPPI